MTSQNAKIWEERWREKITSKNEVKDNNFEKIMNLKEENYFK